MNGIVFKYWFKVVDKIQKFVSGNFKQISSKDKAVANAVIEILKKFKEYKIEMAYFYNKFYVYQENYWNEIDEDLIEVFLRKCSKRICSILFT